MNEAAVAIDEPARAVAGTGSLRFTRAGDRTVLHTARASSPLKLLTPNNHGDAAWVFVATFGGGLVDGDAIALDVRVDDDAGALLGTQASTKVYRSERGSRQSLDADVGSRALLVVVPDPVACFGGARYTQRNAVQLADEASLVLVDAMTCGRAAHGERWKLARYETTTRVTRADRDVVRDALLIDPSHGELDARMGRCNSLATVVAVGPRARPIVDRLLGASVPLDRRAPLLCAASALGDDGAIARIAGDDVERVSHFVRDLLAPIDAILGDDPFARKW